MQIQKGAGLAWQVGNRLGTVWRDNKTWELVALNGECLQDEPVTKSTSKAQASLGLWMHGVAGCNQGMSHHISAVHRDMAAA